MSMSYFPKYLLSSPSKALPCRASSLVISWTISVNEAGEEVTQYFDTAGNEIWL